MEPISSWQRKVKHSLRNIGQNDGANAQLEALIQSFNIDSFEDVKLCYAAMGGFLGIAPDKYDKPIAKLNTRKLDKEVGLYATYPSERWKELEVIAVTEPLQINADDAQMLIDTAARIGLNVLGKGPYRLQKSIFVPNNEVKKEFDMLKRINVLYAELSTYQKFKQEERKRWAKQSANLLNGPIPEPYA